MVESARLWWKKTKLHLIVKLLNTCWQQIKHHKVKTLLIPFLLALALTFIIVSYKFNLVWTGFTGGPESYKTLYDWLQLLFVPAALTTFGFLLNYRESKAAEQHADKERIEEERRADNERKAADRRAKAEQELALDNQREAALQAYLNEMSELLLHEDLLKSRPGDKFRSIARVRTITLLCQLDARRIGYVFSFLRESELMSSDSEENIVSLYRADLEKINFSKARLNFANLSGAKLSNADLSEAELFGANLRKADLSYADLRRADLRKANLSDADLGDANLSGALLYGADLRKADLSAADLSAAGLSGANLRGARIGGSNLSGTDLSEEQLRDAQNVDGAIMPDGSIY